MEMYRHRHYMEFREEGMENGKIQGGLMKVEELAHKEKLLAAGYTSLRSMHLQL